KAYSVATLASIPIDIQAAKVQETLVGRFSKLKESFLGVSRAIVHDRGFAALAKTALGLANALLKVVEAARPLLPLLTTFAMMRLGQTTGRLIGRGAETLFAPPPRFHFARGGVVPGSGDTDSIHSALTPGEFVIKKSSARAIGYDRLHALNEGRPARFAGGGEVHPRPGAMMGQVFLEGTPGVKQASVVPDSSRGFLTRLQAVTHLRHPDDLKMVAGKFRASGTVHDYGLSSAKVFRDEVEPEVRSAMQSAINKHRPPGSTYNATFSQQQFGTISGLLFEKFVSLYAQMPEAGTKASFDFSPDHRQLGGFSSILTPRPSAAGNLFLDAKRTQRKPDAILFKGLDAGLFPLSPNNVAFALEQVKNIERLRGEFRQRQVSEFESKLARLRGLPDKKALGGLVQRFSVGGLADNGKYRNVDTAALLASL